MKCLKYTEFCELESHCEETCGLSTSTFWEMCLFAIKPAVRQEDQYQFPFLFVWYRDVFSLN